MIIDASKEDFVNFIRGSILTPTQMKKLYELKLGDYSPACNSVGFTKGPAEFKWYVNIMELRSIDELYTIYKYLKES